jgi:hypothetical protein
MENREKLLADAKELGLEFTEGVTDEEIQTAIDQALGEENTTTSPDMAQAELEEAEIAENGTTSEGEDVTPSATVAPGVPFDGTPASDPVEPEKTEEELEVERQQAEAVAEAKRKEEEEAQAAIDEQNRLESEAKAEQPSEGSQIAAAIREGLSANKEDKRIKITSDKHVRSMFSVVRSKRTGEIMLKENSTGVLSKVQLKSIEENEADLQTEEVEAV